MADTELAKIQAILEKNAHMNFVQRILQPEKYPVLDNGDDTHSTHLMSYSESDGKYVVYPSIIQYPNGKLQGLDPDRAYNHAMQTGEHISFDSEKEAEWFSQNYKKFWGQE